MPHAANGLKCGAPSRQIEPLSHWGTGRRPGRCCPAHSFITDHADLDPMALGRRPDDGDKSAFNEIDMADDLAGHLKELADIQINGLEGRRQQNSRSACDSTARRRLREPLLGEFMALLHEGARVPEISATIRARSGAGRRCA